MEGTEAEGGRGELDPSGALARAALRESNALSSVATCPEKEPSSPSFGCVELEEDGGGFEGLGEQ